MVFLHIIKLFLTFCWVFAHFQVCLNMILSSKPIFVHICTLFPHNLVYHQCLMCIFDVNTSTPLKIEKLQQKGARHTFNLFFLSSWFLFILPSFSLCFVGFSFICSTYSSVHHGFSSYHQAFLDFLLGFSSYV